MPPPPADRALRTLIAGIARAHPDDVDAVFARLEPAHARRARALLASYLGRELPPPDAALPTAAPPPPPTETWPDSLSRGLRDRLDGGFGLTPMALEALRASARELPQAQRAPAAREAARPRRAAGLGGLLRRTRA